ncbi:hypothetical protein FJ979_25015, partial [Mesorhizobium sp. B1-1-6]
RYGATNGALASGFVTAELHHLWGHDHSTRALNTNPFPPVWAASKTLLTDQPSCASPESGGTVRTVSRPTSLCWRRNGIRTSGRLKVVR